MTVENPCAAENPCAPGDNPCAPGGSEGVEPDMAWVGATYTSPSGWSISNVHPHVAGVWLAKMENNTNIRVITPEDWSSGP